MRRATRARTNVVSETRTRDEEKSSWHENAKRAMAASLCAATLAGTLAPTASLAIELTIVDPSVKQYMDSRDDAMRMKCEGGMMDCDGDRREYAQKQAENFVARNSGEDRFEDFGLPFQQHLRAGFLALAAQYPQRCRIIDGNRNPEAIFTDVLALATS